MKNTYSSGRPRVHCDAEAQRIADAIEEYARYAACAIEGKGGDDVLTAELSETVADLCDELTMRLRDKAATEASGNSYVERLRRRRAALAEGRKADAAAICPHGWTQGLEPGHGGSDPRAGQGGARCL
jgi:hypothetical protein